MTPISPQDRGKVFGLVAAVVVVFGLLFWRIMSASAPETKPPDVVKLDVPTTSTGSPGAPAPTAPLPVVDVVLPPNADKINPFHNVIAASSGPTGPVNPGPRPPGPTGGTKPIVPILPQEFPTEEPRLTGVMTGNPPLGVFVVAGKEEIVRVGETMSNGFLVASISGDTAVLTKKKTKIRIRVGAAPTAPVGPPPKSIDLAPPSGRIGG